MPEEKDPAALRPTAEHVFAARFPGYCDIGHDTIEPGDLRRMTSCAGHLATVLSEMVGKYTQEWVRVTRR